MQTAYQTKPMFSHTTPELPLSQDSASELAAKYRADDNHYGTAARRVATRPVQLVALDRVVATHNLPALENFARAEQAKRDKTADETWEDYHLHVKDENCVVKDDGTCYFGDFSAEGLLIFPFVEDQKYCDKVNTFLRNAGSCIRLVVKHEQILRRLREARYAAARVRVAR